ncbi:IucA/IucC family protein [Frankia sp. AvcI1]|uniref:IucA/IucC family protein n=1 Tax=Frankia sp. AvcI1 TaxID=573496 RepID=UPI00211938C2|nr:IucA/IucC family protein [Frankia sp. AvcI1]
MTLPPPTAGFPPPPVRPGGSAYLWRQAGRALLTKLIAELAYEDLLRPQIEDDAGGPDLAEHPPIGRGPLLAHQLVTAGAVYRFRARRGTFGSWWIDPASLTRTAPPVGGQGPLLSPPSGPEDHRPVDPHGQARSGAAAADDPVRFLRDAQPLLGWPDPVVADVVRDLLATQSADQRLLATASPAASLAGLSFVALEGHQSGHPCLVANKGRLGFGAAASRFTPEARSPFRLRWVAAHPTIGRCWDIASTGPDHPDESTMDRSGNAALVRAELDSATRAQFADVLGRALVAAAPPGDAPARASQPPSPTAPPTAAEDYVWLPVHPWQWENVIVPLFAAELATGLLVPLGEGPDRYLPLQAVRTLANIDRPERRNVKLALMIRNTLVWRGMSAADAAAGPAVSRWLLDLRDADPFLREVTGVLPLPEVAGAAVGHGVYDAIPGAPYRLHELLGVIWRDPVERHLVDGEQARSLASLLTIGSDGRSLTAELVARSGQSAHDWLAALFAALLPPLLHYLYRYGVAFTPHGENIICIFDAEQRPRRIAVKDFGADIELVDGDFPERAGMPAQAAAYCRRWPGPLLAHSVLSAVFAGHFRYFSVLAADHLQVEEGEFWRLVRAAVDGYHARFPQLRDRFREIDLLTPRFDRVCLNREQLAGAGFHDRADRDGGFDLMHGEVANPVATITARGPASPAEASMAQTEGG